jgi:HrpA-like RNA helicase
VPWYSALSDAMQAKVFKSPGQYSWKVVVSTNIAELSATVPNVVYVVDVSLKYTASYSPRKRVHAITLAPITKDEARQRKGVVGRRQSGICIRLYSQNTHDTKFAEPIAPDFLN